MRRVSGRFEARCHSGSIDGEERVIAVAESGAAGFTVGTAALEEVFPAETAGSAAQVRALLEIISCARSRSTVPRRLTVVAHESRKSHLRAWVLRHSKAPAGHRLICTGGTGAMITEAVPGPLLNGFDEVRAAGTSSSGADRDGAVDGVVFFADPMVAHGGDVDLQALMRLAIVHDIPIALSVSVVDMLVATLLAYPRL